MALLRYSSEATPTAVWTAITVTNGNRKAEVDTTQDTDDDLYADFIFDYRFASITGISAGDAVMEFFILPSDGAATPVYPNGGDGTSGDDIDPQAVLLVGVIETRAPSVSVSEIGVLPGIQLPPNEYRMVMKNVSGQTINTFELRRIKYKIEVV